MWTGAQTSGSVLVSSPLSTERERERKRRGGERRGKVRREGEDVLRPKANTRDHEQGRLMLCQNSSLFKLLNIVVLPSLSYLKLQDCLSIWMSLVFRSKVGATSTSVWMSRACSSCVQEGT